MTEQNPPVGSSAWMEKMNRMEADLEAAKKNRPPKVHERVDLDQAEREERARKASHPAGHIRTGAPVGTSTVGESSRGKDPGH